MLTQASLPAALPVLQRLDDVPEGVELGVPIPRPVEEGVEVADAVRELLLQLLQSESADTVLPPGRKFCSIRCKHKVRWHHISPMKDGSFGLMKLILYSYKMQQTIIQD